MLLNPLAEEESGRSGRLIWNRAIFRMMGNDGEAGAYPSRAGCAHKMVDNRKTKMKDEQHARAHILRCCVTLFVFGGKQKVTWLLRPP